MAKGDFDFPLCNPLKTTKKGAAAPSLGFSPGGQLVRRKFVIFANVGRTHGGFFYIVGADDSVRPSKFVEFSWPFVGADAYIGPLKMLRFRIGFP